MKILINLAAALCLLLGYSSLSLAEDEKDSADTKYGPVLKVKPKGVMEEQEKSKSADTLKGQDQKINGGLNRDLIRRVQSPKPKPKPKP